jgi:lysophospholipase L1-like esterase
VARRLALTLAAIVVFVGLGLALYFRTHGEVRAERGSLLLVGDSLNVGIEPYLRDVFGDWEITSDDAVGRSTADGVAALERLRATPGPVVVSLGTNDDPSDAGSFHARVEELLRLVAGRCVIWATLWRDGAPEEGLNEVLHEIARSRPNLHLLDWAAMLEAHPEWRAPDETHGSPDGYRARAEEVAKLARSCARGSATAG